MKMPNYVVRIGGCYFVVANKNGIGAIKEFLVDAIPVNPSLHEDPPKIELSYVEEPRVTEFLQEVECVRIPAGVVWTQKTKSGEVQVVRPVEKQPKALKAPKAKALPTPRAIALKDRDPQAPLELQF